MHSSSNNVLFSVWCVCVCVWCPGEPEATPPALSTGDGQSAAVEFSLSYTASSEEDQSEGEDEGSYSLSVSKDQAVEEIVSQTIVTAL